MDHPYVISSDGRQSGLKEEEEYLWPLKNDYQKAGSVIK
jgi:hypothetical protein